jgi:competence protein ComEC
VLRAVAMAGIAALASSSGRSLAGIQALGLSVAALVLVDPLLVHALGFRLSVAASGGILLLSPRLRDRLPGPRWLAEAAAVTIAAQVAVAPLLLPAFGGMPVAALPANVLAGPAAGPITAWGLTGGLLAGFVPGPVASLLHLPTRLLLWWIDAVAHAAVRASLGELGVVHVVALVVLIGAALLAVRRWPRRVGVGVRSSVALLVVLVLVQPAVALRGPHPSAVDLHGGAVLHRAHGGSVLVVDGRSQPAALLEALRRQGVTRLDLVVARTAGAGLVLDVLRQRYRGVQVAGPEGASDADLVVSEPTVLAVGAVALMVVPRGASLVEEGPPSGSDTGPVR